MTIPSASPQDASWEAMFYDWHNERRLKDQTADVPYWLATTRSAARLLVLGSGTGRVAIPLASAGGRSVVALDIRAARLHRIRDVPNLSRVCGDLRCLPLSSGFDTAIVPYSTFQLLESRDDRRAALSEAARVLAPRGELHIDVSSSFDVHPAADWHLTVAAPCELAGGFVEEWERRRPEAEHVVIDKLFRMFGETILVMKERWTYLKSLKILDEMERAGFLVTGIDRGYGKGSIADPTSHRLIYHGRLT
jgi:ubiquinone/menaquinone biosynthesis C-methylase UbiE